MPLEWKGYNNDPQYFPEHIRDGLERWVSEGIMPGGFLTAVLENDLFGALGKADEINQRNIHGICSYIYNHTPGQCWGSAEKMAAWQRLVRVY